MQDGDAGEMAHHGRRQQMERQVQQMRQHGAEHPRVTEQRDMTLVRRDHIVKAVAVPAAVFLITAIGYLMPLLTAAVLYLLYRKIPRIVEL